MTEISGRMAEVPMGTMSEDASVAATSEAVKGGVDEAVARETSGVLSDPSLTVSERSPAEQLLTRPFEAAKETAKNLVDSPEARAKKAEARKREESKREIAERTEILAEKAEDLRDSVPPPVAMV